jgi:hypothetical protein
MNQNSIRKIFIWVAGLAALGVALTLVTISFESTSRIAAKVGIPALPLLALVEIPFILLLLIRAFQQAYRRDNPTWLAVGYFGSFSLVTAVNMYGLSLTGGMLGVIMGLCLSGMMFLMDKLFVWLILDSGKPHQQTARQMLKEANDIAKLNQTKELVKYIHWKSDQPALALIELTRKDAEKRAKVMEGDVPEYIQKLLDEKNQPSQIIEAEEIQTEVVEPIVTNKPESIVSTEIIPLPKRQIGFHPEVVEAKKETIKQDKNHLFKPNTDARQQAIQTANDLMNRLGRVPTKKELMEVGGLSDHYARIAKKSIDTK